MCRYEMCTMIRILPVAHAHTRLTRTRTTSFKQDRKPLIMFVCRFPGVYTTYYCREAKTIDKLRGQ